MNYRVTKDGLLLFIINILNVFWIIRVFYVYIITNKKEINYITDSIFLPSFLLCSLLHLLRWQILFDDRLVKIFDSRIQLVIVMRKVAEAAYSRIPYLFGLMPNDKTLQARASELLQEGSDLKFNQTSEIFNAVLGAKWLLVVHLVMIAIILPFLSFSGLPSYATFLQSVPFSAPLLTCFGTGFVVYSLATVFYFFIFNFTQRKSV